ncbi:TRAFAC clade GTPase domain-containing protein [Candidatus Laterigemmans baculatus]|uniref:TRAFAC clade GTPase domain-containing protein n=1 Tax=Candidatus Laterigemmans baculatus TaxID=2770505 RepID=UPI0013DCB0F1|nr:hypothetical protein [Candidatus Laterigemmans baculatus]
MITAPPHDDYAPSLGNLSCASCGFDISDYEGSCPDCQTPVELSRMIATRGIPQRFVSVLGASGAGKTVYLGLLLDLLNRGENHLKGLANDAFSVALQEQVVTALEHRVFPDKTPAEADAWKWVHCEITSGEKERLKQIDLVAPDFAGEAIAMEISQAGLYPAIRDVVKKSQGLLILCDSLKVRDAGPGEDLFAMKLASYIAQLHASGKESDRKRQDIRAAIAVVFTKSDVCPEAREDPALFAANNMPRLAEFCRRTFGKHAFFAASVAGSTGMLTDRSGRQRQIPLHIEPHGILEPLEWIVANC